MLRKGWTLSGILRLCWLNHNTLTQRSVGFYEALNTDRMAEFDNETGLRWNLSCMGVICSLDQFQSFFYGAWAKCSGKLDESCFRVVQKIKDFRVISKLRLFLKHQAEKWLANIPVCRSCTWKLSWKRSAESRNKTSANRISWCLQHHLRPVCPVLFWPLTPRGVNCCWLYIFSSSDCLCKP